jgi:hypothetical protein
MHNISNLFYFGTTLYMFQMVFLSIIRSLRLYIQHQVYVIQVLWLLASIPASKQPQNLVGFTTEIYYEAWSYKGQTHNHITEYTLQMKWLLLMGQGYWTCKILLKTEFLVTKNYKHSTHMKYYHFIMQST